MAPKLVPIMEQWCIPVSVWEDSKGWYSGDFGLFLYRGQWNITQELVHQPIEQPDKGSSNSGLL